MVRSILALAAVLSVATASLAADLVTPPVDAGSNNQIGCRIANITSNAIPAQIKLVDGNGTSLVDTGPITVAAGATVAYGVFNPHITVYCRFVNASKSKVRAALTASNTGNGDTIIVVAQ
jgi:hypothetical protein